MAKPKKIKVRHVKMRNAVPRKTVLIGVLILLQIVIVILLYQYVIQQFQYILYIMESIAFLVILRIVFANKNSSSKFSWIILVLILPIAAVPYLLWGETSLPRQKQKKMKRVIERTKGYYQHETDENVIGRVKSDRIRTELSYIRTTTGQTANMNIQSRYFSGGESFFEDVKEKLRAAKRYIFLEFFIVADGRLLTEIQEILIERAKAGVEIKLIYDDFGSKSRFSRKSRRELRAAGVEVHGFNRIAPVIDFLMNYRDHRKIVVVDGEYAYTGGVNISGEYANYYQKRGYWKDAGVRIEGREVNDFALMFLRMWEFSTRAIPDCGRYLVRRDEPQVAGDDARDIVCAFDDAPVNVYSPARNLFTKMISNAKRYVYIMTPYLVIEDAMMNDIVAAAQSGVDVRIFTPGIPDKEFVYAVTRSHYPELVKSGVRIFEYTPGFLHAKVLLSDDECGFVGSINMDFRSFYQQYECGAYYANTALLDDIKADFAETERVSREIPADYRISLPRRVVLALYKLFSPLM